MGSSNRPKPNRLPEKLKFIREELDLKFEELIDKLDCSSIPLYRASITQYENGQREPPLQVLLQYARLANVWLDVLVDDALDLPAKLPSKEKSEGIRRE